MTLYSKVGALYPVAPFDFKQSLRFLGMFAPMRDEQTLQPSSAAPTSLTKAVQANGQTLVFQVYSTGTVEQPELHHTLWSEQPLDEQTESVTLERIRFFLSLDDDLQPFYQIGQADPHFAAIIQQLYGYHQVKFLTPFENAAWAVLSQRNLMTTARKMKQALTEKYGSSLVVNGVCYWAFPEPERIAASDPSELFSMIKNERRVEYLTAVAQAFSATDESFLRSAPYEIAQAWLRKVKGIGEWSAAFILLRGLGRMERAPRSERRSYEAAVRVYGAGKPLTDAQIEQIAQRYGDYQGYWAHYLRVAA